MQTTYALKPIKTEADHAEATELVERLWDAKPGTAEAEQLEILGILIDQYEAQKFPISTPNAV
tara:strand:+ start:452 stop:640 length:189 start_codon:yes stop_codon:yes gene_type:complete